MKLCIFVEVYWVWGLYLGIVAQSWGSMNQGEIFPCMDKASVVLHVCMA